MLNKVAKFHKVSYEQFEADFCSKCEDYTYPKELIKSYYDNIKLPKRATSGSAGYDFYAPFHIILEPNKAITIPTGIKCEMENDWFLSILPRSGHGFKYGLRVINTVGIIDSDYINSDNEGHIMIKLINDSSVKKTIDIVAGVGMAQGIFIPYGITVDDNVESVRNGGFGSTDTK